MTDRQKTAPTQYDVAQGGAERIAEFYAGGGRFDDTPDAVGMTAALYVAREGDPAAIRAFAKAGGKFTDYRERCHNHSAAMLIVIAGPEAIEAYAEAGGTFCPFACDKYGKTAKILAQKAGPATSAALDKALAAQLAAEARTGDASPARGNTPSRRAATLDITPP